MKRRAAGKLRMLLNPNRTLIEPSTSSAEHMRVDLAAHAFLIALRALSLRPCRTQLCSGMINDLDLGFFTVRLAEFATDAI